MTEPAKGDSTAVSLSRTEPDRRTTRRPAGWRMAIAERLGVPAIPFAWLRKLVTVIVEAVPVGLLRRSEIEHVVHAAYAEVPDFYHPSDYPIRYEEELVPIIERTIGAIRGLRLLDLYCGHGREAEIFARAGFDVSAVDAQPAVIERAREYAKQAGFIAEFTAADIDRYTPSDSDWDVVYTSLWMYSTVPDQGARVRWLKRLSGWVKPGGCLIISTTPRPAGIAPIARHLLAHLIRVLSLNSRRPEFGDRFHNRLFWHDFSLDTLLGELDAAELEILDSLEIAGGTPCNFYLLRASLR